ncbi:MAG: zinc-binding alcohol dehydrogenase [Clostridia bacterium]|nr:zinc-binding alcohol dehydrogenase [Clostridia bacterium]
MENKTIAFTSVGVAELLDMPVGHPTGDQVLVKTEYTVISAGTERACLLDGPNVIHTWPKLLGYSGVGRVVEVGESVKDFAVGDRVLVYHGHHAQYNLVQTHQLTKITDDRVDSKDAAYVIVASMGLGGVRKLELELAESAMVMGLGILGIFAVQQLALSGANPLIAVDFNEERRKIALELGADYALNPGDPDFVEQVKKITGGRGVNATVEVTGSSVAMKQALDCASYMGRIALLGCTRVSDCAVDYYQQVHRPGVKLIGAHNFVRPKVESFPHHWTHHDDCRALLGLIGAGKLKIGPIRSRICKPEEGPALYDWLSKGKNEAGELFPLGIEFDWNE